MPHKRPDGWVERIPNVGGEPRYIPLWDALRNFNRNPPLKMPFKEARRRLLAGEVVRSRTYSYRITQYALITVADMPRATPRLSPAEERGRMMSRLMRQ